MLIRGSLWVSGGTSPGVAFGVNTYAGFIGALLSGLSSRRQASVAKRGTMKGVSVGYVTSYRFVCAGSRFV